MKMRHRIAMCLMDGNPHKLGDFLGYLTKSIDPKMAVRKYLYCYKREEDKSKPLDYQIKFGSKLIVKECIRTMLEDNIICQSQTESEVWKTEDTEFEITEKGKEWLVTVNPGNNPLNSIFEEMAKLYKNGQLDMVFSLKNSAGVFQ